jgi:hypothetical protein
VDFSLAVPPGPSALGAPPGRPQPKIPVGVMPHAPKMLTTVIFAASNVTGSVCVLL